MIRFLLTLLAFMTGLAAIAPEAEARSCGLGTAEVGAVESLPAGDRVAVRQQGVVAPRARRDGGFRQTGCVRQPRRPVYIPTVQFGPDRAYE
jgi:hypothetical protein